MECLQPARLPHRGQGVRAGEGSEGPAGRFPQREAAEPGEARALVLTLPPAPSESCQEKERQLRARVKRILPIDVHQPQPLGTGSLAPLPADALVSAFCLEAVSPDLASFQRALDHITTLLRSGGHLLLIGALEESWYLAGEARLAVVPVCEEEVREALARSGYEVRDLRTYVMPAHLRTGVDDVKGIFFAWAQKKVGV